MKTEETQSYLFFFFPELKPFLSQDEIEEQNQKINDYFGEEFETLRKQGENPFNICKYEREDNLDGFISCLPDDKSVEFSYKPCPYDTNQNLTSLSYLDYACYYGSLKITDYILKNKKSISSFELMYAAHSQKVEIIDLLAKNKNNYDSDDKRNCFLEAIKCHHNEMARYIKKKFYLDDDQVLNTAAQYYNFEFIEILNDPIAVNAFIKFDHLLLSEQIMKSYQNDINQRII